MKYLRIRNFEKFQHYKDRNPPWIKMYAELWGDFHFFKLPDASKAHLLGLFMLASKTNNKIPLDLVWIKHEIRATEELDMQTLLLSKFVETIGRNASSVLAESKQHATPRALARDREETETETEEIEKPSLRSGKKKDSEEFVAFWDKSTKRGSRKNALKSWEKINASRDLQAEILLAMLAWMQSDQWQDETKQPHVSTWLNREGWTEIVPRRKVAPDLSTRTGITLEHPKHFCRFCDDGHEWVCDEGSTCGIPLNRACMVAIHRMNRGEKAPV